jgi:hypothetical protein
MDIPQDGVQIGQKGSCATAFASLSDCKSGYEKYGMVVTSLADQAGSTLGPAGSGSAGTNLYEKPYQNGTGSATVLPTSVGLGTNGCTSASGCSNNGANFGSVTGTIGSSRLVTMDLHVIF